MESSHSDTSQLYNVYGRIFHSFIFVLRSELEECQSFLDLGCGRDSPVKYFSKEFRSVGVDLFKPSIEESRTKGIHDRYVLMDLRKLHFKPKSFDAVLAIDVIEHLEKSEGEKLLGDMEKIARKKVIVFTPNGFIEQEEHNGNRYQVHMSGWSVSEMRERGYRVVGMRGFKPLRWKTAEIRYSPKSFWWVMSTLSELCTYHFPEYAFQLFCVKSVG